MICSNGAFQLLAALAIARLAVYWAHKRFKSEKAWERQIAALSDVLVALNEMQTLNNSWIEQVSSESETIFEGGNDPKVAPYQAARKKLREVSAIASLILSRRAADIIEKFEKTLDYYDEDEDFIEQLDRGGMAIRTARENCY